MTSDFDFLFGDWHVTNRRLRERLAGSDDWEVFAATSSCRPLFGGAANLDEIELPALGVRGLTLRLFDPARQQWRLHWTTDAVGVLFPPVTGRFSDGVGRFFGEDIEGGTPVRVRFVWDAITPDSARWQQAFSADDGRTWETNWVMELSRR
ncbi:hypothetical protein ACQP2C_26175 [Micromonospora zamorensis]|uniref:hypothetical protein n=1 Tax=Micromonospora zamorensis TaxID=709883 RepID=UPI003D97DE55